MPAPISPVLRKQIFDLLAQGLNQTEVSQRLPVSRTTVLRLEAARGTREIREIAVKAAQCEVARVRAEVGNEVREALGTALAAQVRTLAAKPGKTVSDLRNTPARQGLAAVAKTLAETGAAVFGWSASDVGGMVKPGEMRALDEVIDITPEPPKELNP